MFMIISTAWSNHYYGMRQIIGDTTQI